MIPTLGKGLLYQVNRDRVEMQDAIDKRKTFWFICGIVFFVTLATYIALIYHE